MKQTLVLLNVSGHGSNSPKYCENSSALRVALMRITFRSGLVGRKRFVQTYTYIGTIDTLSH